MAFRKLLLTNGIDTVDLVALGVFVTAWRPQAFDIKEGGIWDDPAFRDGRRLKHSQRTNVIENMTLTIVAQNADDFARKTSLIRRLIESARQFWTNESNQSPVYLEATFENESNTRYALIMNGGTQEDPFPFGGVYYQPTGKAGANDWPFILEREPAWRDAVPQEGTAIEVSGIAARNRELVNQGFEAYDGGAADLFTGWDSNVGGGVITVNVGEWAYQNWYGAKLTEGGGLNDTHIMQTFKCRPAETFVWTFWNKSDGNGVNDGRYRVWDITNAANIIATVGTGVVTRTWNEISVSFTAPAGCYEIRVYLYCPAGAAADSTYFDKSSILKTVLAITTGRAATVLADEVFFSNKHVHDGLTDIWFWDDGANNWVGGNYAIQGLPWTIGTNPIQNNDRIYFGIVTTASADLPNATPFDNLIFDLSQAVTGGTVTTAWGYWNGGEVALFVQDNTQQNGYYSPAGHALDTVGVKSTHWIPPDDWAVTNPNPGVALGVTGWWVWVEFSVAAGNPVPPVQQTRPVYTCNWPYIDVAADQLTGDIGALIRLKITQMSDVKSGYPVSTPESYVSRLLVGSRSLSRGADFTPYLNCSYRDAQWGIDVRYANLAFFANSASPTGYTMRALAGAGAYASLAEISITEPRVRQYYGRFRLLARVEQEGGSAGDVRYRMQVSLGDQGIILYTRYAEPLVVDEMVALDFGQISLPGFEYDYVSDAIESVWFSLYAYDGAGARNSQAYDFILFPIDEWSAEFISPSLVTYQQLGGEPHSAERRQLDIDSIYGLRSGLRALQLRRDRGYKELSWIANTPKPAELQAQVAQRIWFFSQKNTSESETLLMSHFETTFAVSTLEAVQRYITQRGDR